MCLWMNSHTGCVDRGVRNTTLYFHLIIMRHILSYESCTSLLDAISCYWVRMGLGRLCKYIYA